MHFQLFQYPLPAPPDLADLNGYLQSHRVVAVTHHIVQSEAQALLVFLVQTTPAGPRSASRSEPRIDYKAVLDADQFARFSRLREERKKIAEEEGVPVYAIFTNAQLAEIVQRELEAPSELAAIERIGEGRVEKFAERLLALGKEEA